MGGRVSHCDDATMGVPEEQHLLEPEVLSKFLDVGDVIVDLISPRICRPVRTARAAWVEHDQRELLPQAGEVSEIRRREAWPSGMADEHRAGPHVPVRQLATVRGGEFHIRRGSGRHRPPSSRYPAGWSGSWLSTRSHRCFSASSKSLAFSSKTRSGSMSADMFHGTFRCGVWQTRSPVTAQASSPDVSTRTWLPGVWPPTCLRWTPGMTSASPSRNSTSWLPSASGVKSSWTYPAWLRTSGC